MSRDIDLDCIVIGGGPTGLAAAAAIATTGVGVALVARERFPSYQRAGDSGGPERVETRTAALFPASIQFLRSVGAWSDLATASAPLLAIRIVDDTGRLLRAPELVFHARDILLESLGFNVSNDRLVAALAAAARRAGVAVIEQTSAVSIQTRDAGVEVRLDDGRAMRSRLVVAADGRGSATRAAANIAYREWPYEQAALACRFEHSRPHHGISTELQRSSGPCTTVPLPGNASSLVWMEDSAAVAELVALPPDQFLARLGERLGGLLGSLSQLGARRSFPLSGLLAETMAAHRIALVGEAAHAFPPIGAQGLNLGLTDAAVLADTVADARKWGLDIGLDETLGKYNQARRADVHRRTYAVDMLNRSLQPQFWPLGLARGAGLHLIGAMPALRRRIMLSGLFPPSPLPRLMQAPPAALDSG